MSALLAQPSTVLSNTRIVAWSSDFVQLLSLVYVMLEILRAIVVLDEGPGASASFKPMTSNTVSHLL